MAFYGLCIGICAGAVYDLLRIRRIAFSPHRYGQRPPTMALDAYFAEKEKPKTPLLEILLISIGDFLFLFALGCAVSILVFYENDGVFRWYALLSCVAGFFLYRNTLGRIVVRCADAIIASIKQALRFLWRMTWLPLQHFCQRIGRYFYRKLSYRYRKNRTKRIFLKLEETLLPATWEAQDQNNKSQNVKTSE